MAATALLTADTLRGRAPKNRVTRFAGSSLKPHVDQVKLSTPTQDTDTLTPTLLQTLKGPSSLLVKHLAGIEGAAPWAVQGSVVCLDQVPRKHPTAGTHRHAACMCGVADGCMRNV